MRRCREGLVVGGVVSLGLILDILQRLFVLFFTWWRESRAFDSGSDFFFYELHLQPSRRGAPV